MTEPSQAGHPSNPATTRRNRLANETSPYLLQHQTNPVDWYPWGAEALARARAEDKPIFLSIGYSSCHWCHVMERESFEDESIAQLLNEHFVPVKVDREERPDLDDTYMRAVQLMTGSGGWPMSVWLTPELEPFYGGTYFPPTDRYGRPGFSSVLRYLAELWVKHRDKATDSGKQMAKHLASMLDAGRSGGQSAELDVAALLAQTVDSLLGYFDPREGGFGGAPKFPHPMDLAFLLRRQVRGRADGKGAIELSLSKMARGGIYDQVGGGFHRYAVDERWLVPHFEKMLYDNALLLPVYAEAARAYSVPLYERVARETADYVLREMTDREGAFYCATDADSEGEEGLFFTWTMADLERVLGKDRGRAFGKAFGATDSGNFEHGRNVLEQLCDEATRASFAAERAKLYAERDTRIKPLLDDKILVEWNGLMIAGLARAGALLGEPRYVAAAQRAASFLLDRMWDGSRLLRTHRGGISKIDAFLSDYANLAHGLLELSAVTTDPRFLRAAIELVAVARTRFGAPDGGFFSTSLEHEALLGRSRDPYDNATPSGNSVMATNLLRLAEITGEATYEDEARRAVTIFASNISDSPAGFGWLVQAADLIEKPPTLVVIVGDPNGDARALHAAVHASFRPGVFVLATDGKSATDPCAPGALAGKSRVAGQPAAYVCTHGRCLAPTTSPQQLGIQLDAR